LVDAVGQQNRNDSLWPLVRGYAALDRGDFNTARGELAKLLPEGSAGDQYLSNQDLNLARMEWSVINRLDGRETDWNAVKRGIELNGGFRDAQVLALDWLSGAVSWEDSLSRVATTKDGDELFFYQALVSMTTGDHEAARQSFQLIMENHPNWVEVTTCQAMLRWYKTQTPESLAKIATAKPIGSASDKPQSAKPRPIKPVEGANDF
jgi:hypothetical protein